jgi:hypothetical protein
MLRRYSQIPPSPPFFLTVVDTMYMYPTSNIEAALGITPFPHTYTGDQIISPTLADLNEIAYAIWYNTYLELPDPNPLTGGFNVKVGCLLRDLGKVLSFELTGGSIVATWRLMELITDQIGTPNAGQAPPGTIGYVPVFNAGGTTYSNFDPVHVARVG